MRRRLGNLLVLLIAVATLYGMQRTKPRYMDLTGAIPVHGRMHETVETRQFEIRVDDVTFARQLTLDNFGAAKILTTTGIWAVVSARLGATSASNVVSQASWLGQGGLRYDNTDRTSLQSGLPPHTLDPGLPKQVRFVFEILPDQTSGATLIVSNYLEPRLDSEARIAIDDFKKFNDGQPLIAENFDMRRPIDVSEN